MNKMTEQKKTKAEAKAEGNEEKIETKFAEKREEKEEDKHELSEKAKEAISEAQGKKLSEEIQKKVEEMKGAKAGAVKKEVQRTDEKEYVIPIRAKLVKVQKYRRAGKAIKIVKEFLVRHMKIRDRDLNKIRVDRYLNDFIWARGIRSPPVKVKVKVYKEGDIVRAELAEGSWSDNMKFKKSRLENRDKKAADKANMKKVPAAPKKEDSEGNKEEVKEKKAAVVESGKQMEKAAAKQSKHTTKGSTGPKTKPIRKALGK